MCEWAVCGWMNEWASMSVSFHTQGKVWAKAETPANSTTQRGDIVMLKYVLT